MSVGLHIGDKVKQGDDVAVFIHSVFVNVTFYQITQNGSAG